MTASLVHETSQTVFKVPERSNMPVNTNLYVNSVFGRLRDKRATTFNVVNDEILPSIPPGKHVICESREICEKRMQALSCLASAWGTRTKALHLLMNRHTCVHGMNDVQAASMVRFKGHSPSC